MSLIKGKIHVGVLDAKPIMLYGLQSLFSESNDIEVSFLSANIDSFFANLEINHSVTSVVVCDYEFIHDPQPDGLAFLKKIKRSYPKVTIVLFSSNYTPYIVSSAIDVGALGFVDKFSDVHHIVKAIEYVRNTEKVYFSENVMKQLLTNVAPNAIQNGTASLSKSEFEVVRLVSEGLSLNEIAVKLHKSPKTISNQKNSAMKKIGLNNKDALASVIKMMLRH